MLVSLRAGHPELVLLLFSSRLTPLSLLRAVPPRHAVAAPCFNLISVLIREAEA